MKVIFTQGIQGSGKSFWAKEYCIKNSSSWVRVSRDDLRNMRGKYWLPKQEDLITDWERDNVLSALRSGMNVVIDAMNLNEKTVNSMKSHIKANGFESVEYSFQDFTGTPLETCIKRDMERPNSIGEKIIRQTWNKYLAPKIESIKQDINLPHCIIQDLDGSISLLNGRNPYDASNCDQDLVNEFVLEILKKFVGKKEVIFVSGREDKYRIPTEKFLLKCGFLNHQLYMRKTDDFRSDVIVKKEIYENQIKNKYYVYMVIDDRPKVIRMWKELGFNVLDVGDGIEF